MRSGAELYSFGGMADVVVGVSLLAGGPVVAGGLVVVGWVDGGTLGVFDPVSGLEPLLGCKPLPVVVRGVTDSPGCTVFRTLVAFEVG